MSRKTMRTGHVGGLVRPREVIGAFIARGKDEIDDDELARVHEEAVRDFVAEQEAVDIDMVSDCEYRRLNWQVSYSARFCFTSVSKCCF